MKQKKLSRTFGKLRAFFTPDGKRKKKKQATVIIIGIIVLLTGLIVGKTWYTNSSNKQIRNNVAMFNKALNDKDWEEAKKYLTNNEENEIFLLNLNAKMLAIQVNNIKTLKIFPAIVDNELAIVGYSMEVSSSFPENPQTIQEFTIRFLVKENGDWKFASRKDLTQYPKQELQNFIDEYVKYLKENVLTNSSDRRLIRAINPDEVSEMQSIAEYRMMESKTNNDKEQDADEEE